MNSLQVGSLDDIRITEFGLSVKLADGRVQLIPGGVTSLMNGELSFISLSGESIPRSAIFEKVNSHGDDLNPSHDPKHSNNSGNGVDLSAKALTPDEQVPEETLTSETEGSYTALVVSGNNSSQESANHQMLTFSGKTDPGAAVKLKLRHAASGQKLIIKVSARSDGSWYLAIPASQILAAEGEWAWNVTATDVEGKSASTTSTNEFTLAKQASTPVQPTTAPDVQPTVQPATSKTALPVAVTLASPVGSEPNRTNEAALELVVTADPGSQVLISIFRVEDGGVPSATPAYGSAVPAEVPISGQLLYRVPHLDDGEYMYFATVVDTAGNQSTTSMQSVTIDTTPDSITDSTAGDSTETAKEAEPAPAERNHFVTATLADVAQIEYNGMIYTQDNYPMFDGAGELGDHIMLTLTGPNGYNEKFTTVVDAYGDWSLNVSPGLSTSGVYGWAVVATDNAGNTDASQTGVFTLDTVPPPVAEVPPAAVTKSAATQGEPTFVVRSAGAEKVQLQILKDGAAVYDSATVDVGVGGETHFVNTGLANGSYSYIVTVQESADKVGAEASASALNTMTLSDVVLDGIDDDSYHIYDPDLSFHGQAEPGAYVSLTLTTDIGNTFEEIITAPPFVTADADGYWHFVLDPTLAQTLADGIYYWSLVAQDDAGHHSEPQTGHFILDTEIPMVSLDELSDASDLDELTEVTDSQTKPELGVIIQSDLEDGSYTNDRRLNFTGTAAPGVRIFLTLTYGDESIVVQPAHVTSDSHGNWFYVLAPAVAERLADGTYIWQFVAEDMLGQRSEAIVGRFILDTISPIVTFFGLSFDANPRHRTGDMLTNADHPTFFGYVDKAANITLFLIAASGAETLLTTTAPTAGSWSVTPDNILPEGCYGIKLLAIDIAGNISEEISGGTLVIDRTKSYDDGIVLEEASEVAVAPADDDYTDPVVVQLQIKGSDGTVAYDSGEVDVGSDAAKTFTSSSVLAKDQYTYIVTVQGLAGRTSTQGKSQNGDAAKPLLGTVVGIYGAYNGEYVNTQRVTFTGTAEPLTSVHLTLTDEWGTQIPVAPEFVITNEKGLWQYSVTTSLADGHYIWSFIAEDNSGNRSPAVSGSLIMDTSSSTVSYTGMTSDDATDAYDVVGDYRPYITATFDSQTGVDDDEVVYTNNSSPSFSGTGIEGDRITLILTGADNIPITATTVVDALGHWTIVMPELTSDGRYRWSVAAVDTDGNAQPHEIGSFILDTVQPHLGAVVLEEAMNPHHFGGDDLSHLSTPGFSVSGEMGGIVIINLWHGANGSGMPDWHSEGVIIPASGTTVVRVPDDYPLADGLYSWQAKLVDVAGNQSYSRVQNLTIDTAPPILPVVDFD